MNNREYSAGDAHWLGLRPALWSLLAAAPFLVFPLIHFERWGDDATGLTTYDLPYYAANARAILDRGHAGLYPNPFDPDPAAPVIYFHWLMLALAALIGPLGLDPGHAFLLIQAVGAFASARVMYALIAWLIPDARHRTPLFLFTMWSGGLLVAAQLVANLATGSPWNDNLLALDPGQGLWCLNFGRNLILPTEAFYHALMLGTWLAVLRQRWTTAAVLLLAITTTHPFTGAQALAIVGAWITIQLAASYLRESPSQSVNQNTPPLWFLVAFTLIGVAFVSYYFVFLPRFPQHREIQHTWTLGWTLSGRTILCAYAPAAILAWLAVRSDPAWRRRTAFLLVAAGVSFLLANHQWFITPRQPIHFTRGYIWTPLWLIGLPTLARLLDCLQSKAGLIAPLAICALGLVAISDNAAFLILNATSPTPTGFGLTTDERAAFNTLNTRHLTGVLLTDTDRLGYLAAAYTSARPWLGHKYNTPHFDTRQTKLAAFKSTTTAGDLLDEVDLALTADSRVTRRLQDHGWQNVSTNGNLQLWQKP